MKKYACDDHVELALEEVLGVDWEAPELLPVNNEKTIPTACEYCRNAAIYIVTNERSDT